MHQCSTKNRPKLVSKKFPITGKGGGVCCVQSWVLWWGEPRTYFKAECGEDQAGFLWRAARCWLDRDGPLRAQNVGPPKWAYAQVRAAQGGPQSGVWLLIAAKARSDCDKAALADRRYRLGAYRLLMGDTEDDPAWHPNNYWFRDLVHIKSGARNVKFVKVDATKRTTDFHIWKFTQEGCRWWPKISICTR